MTGYSIDVTYAYAQLGLEAGTAQERIDSVLANAIAYRFSTRPRVKQIERLVHFFAARGKFGALRDSFGDIRKAYHRQAMVHHPDRNPGDTHAEERLKILNAAFALIDEIHREAAAYFRQSESARRESEEEARRATAQETPARDRPYTKSYDDIYGEENAEPPPQNKQRPHAAAQAANDAGFGARTGRRYMAASIPRFMRTARLSHLRLDCVIGCWFVKRERDLNLVYDVIMLPEREFIRARAHLGTPNVLAPMLQLGSYTPSYVPLDVKFVNVPPDEPDPETFARNYFREEFGKEYKISA